MKHVLSVLVDNQAGVLTRVSGLFSRRGYNIDSLTVGVTENPELSRMTICVEGDVFVLDQIKKQLAKLVDVKGVIELTTGNSVYRELALIKVTANAKTRAEIVSIVDIFRAKIIDVAKESLVIELTGTESKLSAFYELMEPYGVIEMVRTGTAALERGNKAITTYILEEEI